MAEFTHSEVQTVAPNQAVLFDETPVRSGSSVYHREGSGIVTLRGLCCGCNRFARFKLTFGGNVAIPEGGTAGPISLAFALSGEANGATQMIVTPAAVSEFFNVARSVYINVPSGCCSALSIENTSTADILVQDANLIVERVA